MLLDEHGNPLTVESAPQPPDGEAPTTEGVVETPPEAGVDAQDPVDQVLAEMAAFQKASNTDTPENRDLMRTHLATALSGFAKLRGSKASLGTDYTISIGLNPKGAFVVDVVESTKRGKALIQEWQDWVKGMEAQTRSAQAQNFMRMMMAQVQALESVVHQTLVRIADLERKLSGKG